MKITISGTPGSGKSSVSRFLAKKLKLKYYDAGGLIRKGASKKELSLRAYKKLRDKNPLIDKKVDDRIKKIGKKNNIVVSSRTAFYFIPDSIRIFLKASVTEGAKRIMKAKRMTERYRTLETAKKSLKEIMKDNKKRYEEYYGINIYDKKNYDLVVDTTNLTVEQTADKIEKFAKKEEMNEYTSLLKKVSYKNVLSRIKYPKLLLLLSTFVLAYFLFYGKDYPAVNNIVVSIGYFGTFIAGMFFVYGFTAAPATALLLIIAREQNLFLAALVAGLGALVGDLIIFSLIKYTFSFADEMRLLAHEKFYVYLKEKIKKLDGGIPFVIKKYMAVVFAGFLIASPLPDEIGVSLLAFSHKVSMRIFVALAFLLNTFGIFVVLLIGKVV